MPRQSLRDYPHLPVLSFEHAMAVFKLAGISFHMLSTTPERPGLLTTSRQSLWLWRKGRNPHPLAMDEVSVLAYRALSCLRERTLPAGKRPKQAALIALLSAVDLNNKTVDLLPAHWRQEVTAPDETLL